MVKNQRMATKKKNLIVANHQYQIKLVQQFITNLNKMQKRLTGFEYSHPFQYIKCFHDNDMDIQKFSGVSTDDWLKITALLFHEKTYFARIENNEVLNVDCRSQLKDFRFALGYYMGYFHQGDSVNELNDKAADPDPKTFSDINKEMQYNRKILCCDGGWDEEGLKMFSAIAAIVNAQRKLVERKGYEKDYMQHNYNKMYKSDLDKKKEDEKAAVNEKVYTAYNDLGDNEASEIEDNEDVPNETKEDHTVEDSFKSYQGNFSIHVILLVKF